ncbi:MAG: baseplate J/gp47 family protein [Peptococcaceae bacterium]|nr:baseplate J/gp47 family protein [Peptococcaceae bacterium]
MAIKPEDILSIKTFAELMETAKASLRNAKFRITNLRTGGVFYTLLQMANQGVADLYTLLKSIVPQMYLGTATGQWLDFRAADNEVYRRPAQKTRGNVVFGRNAGSGNVVIPVDSIVATPLDRYGERLKFLVYSQTVLEDGQLEVAVPCEAEFAGGKYNVGSGQINQLLTNIPGIDYVRNDEDWITREGADEEDDESLRTRGKGKWNELSVGGGRDAYISWAKSITGVAMVEVDDNHPRGQGTVDVIITSSAGVPTQDLIDQVQAYINQKRPLCADVLVLGPTPVPVNWDIVLYVHPEYGDLAGIQAQGEDIIDIMFMYGDTEHQEIQKISPAFGVVRAQAIANFMTIEHVVNVTINQPVADVALTPRQIAVKGTVNVIAQRVS